MSRADSLALAACLGVATACASARLEPGTESGQAKILEIYLAEDEGFVALVERIDATSHQHLTVERLDARGRRTWSVGVRSDPIQDPGSVHYANAGEPLAATNDEAQVFFAHGHTVVGLAPDGSESWSRNFGHWSARPPTALSASRSTVAVCGAAHIVTLDASNAGVRYHGELEEHDTALDCAIDVADTLWVLRRVEPEYGSPKRIVLERRAATGEVLASPLWEWDPDSLLTLEAISDRPGVVLAHGHEVQRLDGSGQTLWTRSITVPEPGCDSNATVRGVAASEGRTVVAFVPMRCSPSTLRHDRTVLVTLDGDLGSPTRRRRIAASGPDAYAVATAVAARGKRIAAAGTFAPRIRLAGRSARGDFEVECFQDYGHHDASGEIAQPIGVRCPRGFERNIYPQTGSFLWWTNR